MPSPDTPNPDTPNPDTDGARELDAFDFDLPESSIAQAPPPERDGGRLLVLDRTSGAREHSMVCDLAHWLHPADLLVVNETRVLSARLRGHKHSGGVAEALLLGPANAPGRYRALLRHSGRMRAGLRYALGAPPLDAELVDVSEDGTGTLQFPVDVDPYASGETPLPPYIRRCGPRAADVERYQTTFARDPGSVAAPTAGLHLSEALLARIEAAEVRRASVVLHVGLGTFRPIAEPELRAGRLHREPYELPQETALAIARTRDEGGRVVAVGTTVTRVLEACADGEGGVRASGGSTDLFLRPGSRFSVVDALLTNFHLPRSSLLMLVAAFAGREHVLEAYGEAVREGYRFFSYGDAMFIADLGRS